MRVVVNKFITQVEDRVNQVTKKPCATPSGTHRASGQTKPERYYALVKKVAAGKQQLTKSEQKHIVSLARFPESQKIARAQVMIDGAKKMCKVIVI